MMEAAPKGAAMIIAAPPAATKSGSNGQIEGEPEMTEDREMTFMYKNWRGETSRRRVLPSMFYFGSTEWHNKPQWFLRAFDLDKREMRNFAFDEIYQDRLYKELSGRRKELAEIGNLAGDALGMPWYKDDQVNFPGATEADGVCIGEHTTVTVVETLALHYKELKKTIRELL
jgi:hypothetical protein